VVVVGSLRENTDISNEENEPCCLPPGEKKKTTELAL
jgi:hypothetical protein